jgi:hypothetical protein
LIRIRRSAFAVIAGFVLVAAAACSSGATAAPAAGGSGAPAANQNDPNSILTSVINGGSDIKSFHIKIAVSGTIKAAALQAAMADSSSSSGIQITSDAKLDGTAIEGDVDVANSAVHLTANVPALQMLGNIPITGDVIVVGGNLYYKVSLLGAKYTQMNLGSLTSGLPVSIPSVLPSPGASDMTAVTDQINQLRTQMAAAGVKITLVGVDKIGGQDANHINVSVPIDKLNAEIAAQASGGPSMTIDSASIDFWVYKSNSRLAQMEIKGASAALGNLDFMITVTDYDQPVTITAPAAGDIAPATGS